MIHQYKNNGYNIVMDVNSGAIHVVDDLMYDMIGQFESLSKEELIQAMQEKHPEIAVDVMEEAYGEIQELKDQNALFVEDVYEPYIDEFTNRPNVVKALCLHIAHDCNLSCEYCFADEGTYNGMPKELMSLEVGKKALDFFL